jgi:hypothetical protein
MAFNLKHTLYSETFEPVTHTTAGHKYFTVDAEGSFRVLYPGLLSKRVTARVRRSTRVELPDDINDRGPRRLAEGYSVVTDAIVVTVRIFAPDGALFTTDEVTLEDLKKYRDLRGMPTGAWRFEVSGRSKDYALDEEPNETTYNPSGTINLSIDETVASESAAPLIPSTPLDGAAQEFTFDLHREGEFVADIDRSSLATPWQGSMALYDPDGTKIRSTTKQQLRWNVPLAALGKSRDAAGAPRLWRLQVAPQLGFVVGPARVSATVLGAGRITTTALLNRVDRLLGPNGSFIKLVGENVGGEARIRVTITDVTAVETIEMKHLLDGLLEGAGADTNLEANKPFTLFTTSQ